MAAPVPTNTAASNSGLPYPLYDAVLDLPHPGASPAASPNIRLFYPPDDGSGNGIVDSLSVEQLCGEFGAETVVTAANGADNGAGQNGAGQQQVAPGAAKVARFAFPEHNDGVNAQELGRWQEARARLGWTDANSGNLNRRDGYLEGVYSVAGAAPSGNATNYLNNPSGNTTDATNYGGPNPPGTDIVLPSYHAFSHRLSNGAMVHGHVRRYLPYHATGRNRRDVGRRCPRALVLLTRNAGGGKGLYSGLLKSMEALILQGGIDTGGGVDGASVDDRLQWFLRSIHREHLGLCREAAAAFAERRASPNGGQRPPVLAKPRILSLPLVELGRGHGLFGPVDVVKFAIPPSFLHGTADAHGGTVEGLSRNDLLPLLRALGIPRTLRLLSALLSEKRVLFTSASVEKLSAAAYGAVALTAQGLLPPPSVFVPVLPPGLASLLRSPSACLIGVLAGPGQNCINLRSLPDIGPVVLFDLDNAALTEPYFHNLEDPRRSVPDITQRVFDNDLNDGAVSIADILFKDLQEVMKADKKLFWQGAAAEKLGQAAAKGKKAATAAMKKGLKYLKSKRSSKEWDEKESERTAGTTEGGGEEEAEEEGAAEPSGEGGPGKTIGKGNYAYEQGFSNAPAEEEARIAVATFFVSLYGDLRSYLKLATPGQPPVVDKTQFLQHRLARGDAQGSGMFLLLNNFLRTASFDAFAAARLAEVQNRRAVAEDAPLFALAANHHRLHRIEFDAAEVRRTVRRVATDPDLPGRHLVQWDGVRHRVLALTSNTAFPGDYERALTELVENCRECSAILTNALMVVWTRMQEGKGLQWKKALLALQVLRRLLLDGPINAVIEAIDGFASLWALKSYAEALRGQNSKLVREAAVKVYALVVDPTVLFARRRQRLNARRAAADPKPSPLRKETRMIRGMIGGFRNIHIALKPAGASVAPAPPTAAAVDDLLSRGTAPPASVVTPATVPSNAPAAGAYSNDLLSMGVAAAPTPPTAPSMTVGGPPQPGGYSNDLLSLSFGQPPAQAAANGPGGNETKAPDAFDMQAVSQATPNAGPPVAATGAPPPPQPRPVSQPTPASASSTAPGSQPMQPPPQPQMAPMQPVRPASAPFAMPSNVPPPQQPMQNMPPQPQPVMNPPPMAMQQPPMNAPFAMANHAPVRPMQQMTPQQPSQPAKAPVMNPPPMTMQQRPPQQQWGNTAAGFAPNGYPSHPPMAPPIAMGAPPAAFPAMQQPGAPAPQFPQGAMPPPMAGMSQHPPMPGMPPKQ
ncbi:hypothetical protein ACHAXT_003427 [Thalassiosira profunda]